MWTPIETPAGSKFDLGKPRMDLISALATTYLAKVLTFGANKYEAHNWRNGIPLSKLIAAAERHITAIKAGIDYDAESGLPHAAHLMCEAMFLIEASLDNALDDRYHYNPEMKDLLEALLANEVSEVAVQSQSTEVQIQS